MKFFYCDFEKFLEILGNYRQEANNIFGFRTFFSNFLLVKCSHVVPCVPLMNVIRDRECFLSPCSLWDKKTSLKTDNSPTVNKIAGGRNFTFFFAKNEDLNKAAHGLLSVYVTTVAKTFHENFQNHSLFRKLIRTSLILKDFGKVLMF